MTFRLRYIPLAIVVASAAIVVACGGESNDSSAEELVVDASQPLPVITDADTVNPWDNVPDTVPGNCVALRTRYLGDLRQVFADSNHTQYPTAERTGISPIHTNVDAWNAGKPLVKITSCADYYVQPLNYSLPYLIPSAADCLHEIGRRFNDSLRARGGGSYRIKVTSVLRTKSSVRRLRRVNRNAIDSSTHQFATTFDISASRFVCDDFNDVNRSLDDLRQLLAEVIAAMQKEKKLFIKYERKNSCFHITSRMADRQKSK